MEKCTVIKNQQNTCGDTKLNEAEQQTPSPAERLQTIVADADVYRSNGNYRKALKLYEEAGELGDAHSQVWAGNFYARGLGVEINNANAMHWYSKAAEQNDVIGLYNLGNMYETGTAGYQSIARAIDFYLLASNAGYTTASEKLGHIYDHGEGISHNYELAVKYYELALQQGSTDSVLMNNLAVCYVDSKGTSKNYTKAEQLLKKLSHLATKKRRKTIIFCSRERPCQPTKNWRRDCNVCMLGHRCYNVSCIGCQWYGRRRYHYSAYAFFLGYGLYRWFTPGSVQAQQEKHEEEQKRKKLTEGYLCPNCGMHAGYEFGAIKKGVSVAIWGIFSDKLGKTYECANCRYKW